MMWDNNNNVLYLTLLITTTLAVQFAPVLAFSLRAKSVGMLTPKRVRVSPIVTLVVEIPMSSVQYVKPLDVKAGAKFYLETPMEQYSYTSSGRSNLHRVKVVYLMQSMYRANLMCFFLHFWSRKDSTVPWNVPHARITPPPWSKHHPRN